MMMNGHLAPHAIEPSLCWRTICAIKVKPWMVLPSPMSSASMQPPMLKHFPAAQQVTWCGRNVVRTERPFIHGTLGSSTPNLSLDSSSLGAFCACLVMDVACLLNIRLEQKRERIVRLMSACETGACARTKCWSVVQSRAHADSLILLAFPFRRRPVKSGYGTSLPWTADFETAT